MAPSRAATRQRAHDSEPVTSGELDQRLAKHEAHVRRTIASLIRAEVGKSFQKEMKEEINKAIRAETRQEIIDLVKQQAEMDENQSSGVTQADLQEKIGKAVSAATNEATKKGHKGIFGSLKEMKSKKGERIVKSYLQR